MSAFSLSRVQAPGEAEELRHEVDCFRLHKKVNSLGHLRQWPRPLETGTKVVDRVESLAGALS